MLRVLELFINFSVCAGIVGFGLLFWVFVITEIVDCRQKRKSRQKKS